MALPPRSLVSIVINNYNYGRFLREAIGSALAQTYEPIEVIVVDDGSTDCSRDVLADFAGSVRILLKPNGGQTSALNCGYRASTGSAVLFLDSDDILLPDAVRSSLSLMEGGDVALVHWPLLEIDASGASLGRLRPTDALPDGDLLDALVLHGPDAYVCSPTSGNLWARGFLEHVFPLPEIDGYRLGGADRYLATLAPLFGGVRALREPLTLYRLHGQNNYSTVAFEERFRRVLWCLEDRCTALGRHFRERGLDVDPDSWLRGSWVGRYAAARTDIRSLIATDDIVVLVDEDNLGPEFLPEYRLIPFTERDGLYWGPPANEEAALRELDRLQRLGARYLAFAWPAFWWLGHYAGLSSYLREHCRQLLENERVIVFDIAESTKGTRPCHQAPSTVHPARDS
jgi:glycosyltransferase involved in cell wall biosynthesis